jgi:hypothetical protein
MARKRNGSDEIMTAVPVLAEPPWLRNKNRAAFKANPVGEARESTHPLPTVEQGDSESQLVTGHSRGGSHNFVAYE